MFGFWLWQTLARGLPQQQIWHHVYFEAHWQLLFDAFNAVPIYTVLLAVGLWSGSRSAVFFAASALLHIALDLPFHREDAHAHWFPLSSWRFVSPVSYWDPAHHGRWFSTLELAGLLAAAVVVARREPRRWVRGVVAVVAAGCAAAWAAVLVLA